MIRHGRRAALAVALALALARGAWASGELDGRLDPETATAVRAIVEEARAQGLPAHVLVAKAQEGATKRAPGPRIVQAVRAHAAALAGAREALGAGATEGEIVAGAGALLVGVDPDTLARLRAARPEGSVVVPLVVLADLVARRVPATAASTAVLAATRAGIRDPDLLALRARVEHDIAAGASPSTAAMLRVRALVIGRDARPVEASRPRAVPARPLREGP